jgi:uncharacterized membrane protein YhiD involved in acid resistance
MDELIKQIGQDAGRGDTVSLIHVLVAILLSFILSLVIANIYNQTYRGTNYSQSYIQTLVIMSVVTAVIMIIIGSNIARAFSLVGALSIIRFRSPIKDTRDLAFIFLTMAIGMACGTKFYDVAIVMTFCMAGIIFFLSTFNIGARPPSEIILKLLVDKDMEFDKAFNDVFLEHLHDSVLLSVDSTTTDMLELIYSISMKKGVSDARLLEGLRAVRGCHKVSLLTGLQGVAV